jgi:drug/metabolite transporter (DMT)-like permease
MPRKDQMDAFGATSLVLFSALFGFNQVVVKVVNGGFEPVFAAGLRSLGAIPLILLWASLRGRSLRILPGTVPGGLILGACFTVEFLLLFTALDLTTVSRMSVIFYSMPIWLSLGAHVLIPGERLSRRKALGLALAFGGVAWAILDRPAGAGQATLAGDLCALGAAIGWASIGLTLRATRIREANPETQLLWQLVPSALILIALAPLFGPLLRELQPIHLWGLAFQIAVIAFAAFVFWLWLMSIYPASSVAAFSFLGPVFGVFFGWLLLGEDLHPSILGALGLVAAGLWLINRPGRAGGSAAQAAAR